MSRHRRSATLVVVVAALALVLGGGAEQSHATLASGLMVRVQFGARTTAPGASTLLLVSTSNTGAATVPASFSVPLPTGFTFAGVANLAKLPGFQDSSPGGAWACRVTAKTLSCTNAKQLGPAATYGALARLNVASSVSPSRVVLRVPGSPAVDVVAGTPSPLPFVTVHGTANVRANQQATETVNVLNTGAGPATSLRLTTVLPPSVVGTWRWSGNGWRCSGGAGSSPDCTLSRSVGVGQEAPALTLAYSLDATRVTALHLQTGGEPSFQQWNLRVEAGGGPKPVTTTSPAAIAVLPPPAAQIVTRALLTHGDEEFLPGTDTTLHVALQNVGVAPTTGPLKIGLELPDGLTLTRATSGSATWSCEGTQTVACTSPFSAVLKRAGQAIVNMTLAVSADAKPGRGFVSVFGDVVNQAAAAPPKAVTIPIVILEGNAGFPSLVLSRAIGNGKLVQVVDGSSASLHTTTLFTERLDVRDAGGAPIVAGSGAELTQAFSAGVTIRSVHTPAGWRCSSGQTLTCTVDFGTDLAPSAMLEGPTISLVDGTATAGTRNWPASIHLVAAGAPRASTVQVMVDVVHGVAQLAPNIVTGRVPTAAGIGEFAIGLRNKGDGPTNAPVRIGIRVPSGARLQHVAGPGWSCALTSGSARCTTPGTLSAGHDLPRIETVISFGAGTAGKTLTLTADAVAGGKRVVAQALVTPRGLLHAVIRAPDNIVFADRPLVSMKEKVAPTLVTLQGDGSGGSGIGVRYLWVQRGGPPVTWLHQPAGTTQPKTADVSFAAPQVTKLTTLVFALTVTDGSASATTTTRVRVVPLIENHGGFNFANAHPKAEKQGGPMREHRKLPRPAEKLKGSPKTTTVTTPHTASAPADTTTAATTTSTVPGTTTTGPQLPALFCELVNKALAEKSFSATLSGVSLSLNNVSIDGTDCSPSTTISFSDSSMTIGPLHATGIAGSVSSSGVGFTEGTLSGPEAWNAPTFTLKSGSGIAISFGQDDSTIEGSVEGKGFGFVPLPSGWEGTTTLDFSKNGNAASITLDANATGPKSDASPNSPAPTATVQGTLADDGTFSLSVDVENVIQLAGSGVAVTGHVTRSAPDGDITVELEGHLQSPIAIIPGVALKTLTVKMAPTSDTLGLSANGSLEFTVPSGSVGINVKLAYDNPSNWSLTAEGTGEEAWQPVPGLTLDAKSFQGAIVAKGDAYELTLHAGVQEWKPTSSITVSNVELNLSNVCKDTGAPCPTDASVFLDLSGDVSFDLPVVGTLKTSIAGSLALPSGEFSVEAKLGAPLNIGAGISIVDASVKVEHGMTKPSEEPSTEAVDSGEFQVDLNGTISVPGIGTLPTVHASFGPSGWAVAVPLGNFKLPGASGDGSQLGTAVLGWASYGTTLTVVDPTTHQPVKIQIPANGFKLTGSFTTPGWLAKTLNLPSDINGRATGTIDPEHDTYGLRMEFSIPSQPYLYGDASSSSSIRLTSTYFEIEKKGADFNIALGGLGTLNVAASATTSASSIDLGVAISYSVSTNTVAGTLTLSSQNGWQNAFGARSLTLFDLALGFRLTLTPPIPLPGIDFAARAVLPPSINNALGIATGAQTTIVASISVTQPCLGIDISDPTNSGINVLSIANGTVTAKEFHIEIAPKGCTVGQFSYDPGLSLFFNGNVAGLPLQIKATVAFAPLKFDASADIGEFTVGGMTIQQTHIAVLLAPNTANIEFSGGMQVFGTNITLKGTFRKTSTGSLADFKGSIDQLTIGDAVSINGVTVSTHVETGTKNVASFSAAGKIDLFGSTADVDFSLSIVNGVLDNAKADVLAKVILGGESGVVLDGHFILGYSTKTPLTVDASVKVNVGGFTVGAATVIVKPGLMTIDGKLVLGGVFSAELGGSVYYGTVPSGTMIALPSGSKVAAQAGDFTFGANNISLSLAGFQGTGNVTIGKAGTNVWANFGAAIQITGTGSDNSVSVQGTFSSSGDFTLTGSAALDLAGFKPSIDVTVAKAGSSVSVSGTGSISFLGSGVTVHGEFAYAQGNYRFLLEGTANLNVGGYNLANSTVKFSNFPGNAGLWAVVNVTAGDTLSFNGRLNVDSEGHFDLGASANVNLRILTVNGSARFYNYGQVCFPVLTGFFHFETRCSGKFNVPPTLTASMTIGREGYDFAASVTISADGSFNATARTPSSGETVLQSGTLDLGVLRAYGEVKYHVQLGISSNSPYLSVDAAGEANIKEQHWFFGWSDWNTLFGVGLELHTNPFSACAKTTIIGYDVRVCV